MGRVIIENKTWYTSDGVELLALNRTTATVVGCAWNADHLEDLAAACLEAAKILRQRESERHAEIAS